jgi:hypothetical protein
MKIKVIFAVKFDPNYRGGHDVIMLKILEIFYQKIETKVKSER